MGVMEVMGRSRQPSTRRLKYTDYPNSLGSPLLPTPPLPHSLAIGNSRPTCAAVY